MESFQYISANNNICNVSQLINLLWKVHFELVNRNTNTIFFLTTLNDGVEELKVKYTKT